MEKGNKWTSMQVYPYLLDTLKNIKDINAPGMSYGDIINGLILDHTMMEEYINNMKTQLMMLELELQHTNLNKEQIFTRLQKIRAKEPQISIILKEPEEEVE